MKKSYLIIAILLAVFVSPSVVDASTSLTCSNVTVGETATCVLKGNETTFDNIDATITLSGAATIASITPGNGMTAMENSISGNSSAKIAYITAEPLSGSFTIATITVRGATVGTSTMNVSGIINGGTRSASANASFNVIAKKTTTTTTTTQRVIVTTQRTTRKPANPTSPAQPTTQRPEITQPVLTALKLNSVKVDDFPVRYDNGLYLVTTESYTEKVTITATADPGVTIIGTGVRSLAAGKNVVELILRNPTTGQTNTYQVVITRPADDGPHDTNLTNLKIVDHEFPFDPNVHEYTVKVPYDVKEIYVLAETLNSDVNISGSGVKTLQKGKNTIYVKVSYGDLQSTDYVITVKRSYGFMILLIISIILGGGILGALYYAFINRKALDDLKRLVRNKATADELKNGLVTSQQVQLNGQDVLGEGKRAYAPTRVVDVKANAQAIRTDVPSRVYANDDVLRSNAPDAQVKLANQAQDNSFEIQNGVNVLKLESKEEN